MLPCKDSNLDKQIQKLSYYHYTTRQYYTDRKFTKKLKASRFLPEAFVGLPGLPLAIPIVAKDQKPARFASLSFLFLSFPKQAWVRFEIKIPDTSCPGLLLAYLDSNQDKQNQNLSYYHYTIGQSPFRMDRKIKVCRLLSQKKVEISRKGAKPLRPCLPAGRFA